MGFEDASVLARGCFPELCWGQYEGEIMPAVAGKLMAGLEYRRGRGLAARLYWQVRWFGGQGGARLASTGAVGGKAGSI